MLDLIVEAILTLVNRPYLKTSVILERQTKWDNGPKLLKNTSFFKEIEIIEM